MNSDTRDITRTVPFWLIFAASAIGGMTNSASTPIIPVYVDQQFGGGTDISGMLISVAAVSSMIAMPIAGSLGDRRGYRPIAVIGAVAATVALVVLALSPTLWGATVGRVLFGFGNAASLTLIMTWLVAMTAPAHRGKALSIFGLSVWIGVALGPQLGAAVNDLAGPTAVFWACAVLALVTVVLIVLLPAPRADTTTRPVSTSTRPLVLPSGGVGALWAAFRAVWVPGVAAAAAWCGEGLMLGFLIVHLAASGIPASGVISAASVFGVFAVSVIVARLALATLPDRVGPLRATAISLVALTAGLVVLGVAGSFWVAALGAALIGVGFSPLYPSLTMLATRELRPQNRALGLGLFSSFTSIGYGGGALIGGLVLSVTTSMWAFLLVAGLQLVALAVVTIFTRDDSPRPPAPDVEEPRDPAA